MLTFNRIENTRSPFFTSLYNLYRTAFPKNERNTKGKLEEIFTQEKRFHSYALLDEEVFVGFVNYWIFDHFFYLEHIAILDQYRDRKLGSVAMRIIQEQTNLPIVFEVELPSTEEASRRIHFYERLGYYVIPKFYIQPPYDGVSTHLQMLIMSNDYDFTMDNFDTIRETLYNEVYKFTRTTREKS